jgi:hypothetical protein
MDHRAVGSDTQEEIEEMKKTITFSEGSVIISSEERLKGRSR